MKTMIRTPLFRSALTATITLAILAITATLSLAQEPGPQVRPFIAVDAPVVAFTHAKVIDGTGAPAREGVTVVLRDGGIEAMGPDGSVSIPDGAEVLDLTGKTLLPGYVMMHEHMFYPAGGGGMYNNLGWSFPRLYLAGGVTTMRTAASIMPYADINLRDMIDAGQIPGPDIDVTGPFLNRPGVPIPAMKLVEGEEDTRRAVRYWSEEGATSVKAYTTIARAELGAAIQEAHALGHKMTGHLCSVTYREAADLGIDNLEHGFLVSTDFVADKEPDLCPRGQRQSLVDLDLDGPEFRSLVQHLVDNDVAITSTMTVFETSTPGRPPASSGALDAMATDARESYLRRRAQLAVNDASPWATLFYKAMEMDKAFVDAGGLLTVGTDPTGYGGVVAGYSNQRAVMLLVEGGFTPEEAIEIATLNGARYLERDAEIGSVEVGKRADLIVVNGDVAENIAALRRTELVFKAGIGYDSRRLFDEVKGVVGVR